MNKNPLRFLAKAQSMKKALITVLAASGIACVSPAARAADTTDALLQAVNFVLTGKDLGDIRIVDRAGCVFERTTFPSRIELDFAARFGQPLPDVHSPSLIQRYYLNNVDLSRVAISR